ncbi:carbon-nitrogen hydrolase family protein [Streptomyces umbrinus]|uniref:carbon-nitrogen hydrolase family protein n=1 Tax=Streptomyces umbrinus TaxID=67370 RepID=UPI003402E67D
MIDYSSTFRVAAVQAEPVWFDLDATVDKAISLIGEAARGGAALIAFPEVFIPGYPYHIWLDSPAHSLTNFAGRYLANSPEVDGPQVAKLLDTAREHEIAVVIGISERSGGTLYMGQLIIGPDGNLIQARRKLQPAYVEQTVFGRGDSSDLVVHQLPFARVGALNCWEHFQPLTKHAMFMQNEQVHVASWPGMSWYQPGIPLMSADRQSDATRMYALEGQTYVVCATQVVTPTAVDFFCTKPEHKELLGSGGGFARIYGPDGSDLAEPLAPDAEGMLFADIDLSAAALIKTARDAVGHYTRPDVYTLQLHTSQARTATTSRAADPASPLTSAGEAEFTPVSAKNSTADAPAL